MYIYICTSDIYTYIQYTHTYVQTHICARVTSSGSNRCHKKKATGVNLHQAVLMFVE